VQIDLNGIAQGYSVDQIAVLLESKGVASYVAELGGEIRVKGRKKDSGEKFRVGIESPGMDSSGDHPLQKMLYMDKGAVTTSGSYRQFHESGGKRITHIINPLTGYPVDNELISVTVYAADAITADGYDNALMLMGLIPAISFTESRPDLDAYFIYRDSDGTIRDTATRHFYELMNQ
jgi:thiamine biosynthesis lipoprotein